MKTASRGDQRRGNEQQPDEEDNDHDVAEVAMVDIVDGDQMCYGSKRAWETTSEPMNAQELIAAGLYPKHRPPSKPAYYQRPPRIAIGRSLVKLNQANPVHACIDSSQ